MLGRMFPHSEDISENDMVELKKNRMVLASSKPASTKKDLSGSQTKVTNV